MVFLIAIFVFALGLCVGSFLNVIIWRLPEGKSIVFPPSHCLSCRRTLLWWENIPLLSYIFLKGRCRTCKARISFQYPLVELLTGLLFLFSFLKFGLSFRLLSSFVFVSVLLAASVIDLRHKIIPNRLIYPALGVGAALYFLSLIFQVNLLLFNSSFSWWKPPLGFLLGGGLLFLIALFKEEGMGGGDIKLAAFMGIFLGAYVLMALFFGFLLGAVVGVFLILIKKIRRKEPFPFGPFLALGALIALFFGSSVWQFYTSFWLY